MKPREVKIAKRIAMDYMLIGIALGGSGDLVQERIDPSEMLTQAGKLLMEAALTKNKPAILDYFSSRMGFTSDQDESVCESIIRMVKEGNNEHYAYEIGRSLSEELTTFDNVEDMIALLERATVALKASRER